MKPLCPICQTPIYLSASLHLGGMVATCPYINCSAGEIVEVADNEGEAVERFEKSANTLTTLKSDL